MKGTGVRFGDAACPPMWVGSMHTTVLAGGRVHAGCWPPGRHPCRYPVGSDVWLARMACTPHNRGSCGKQAPAGGLVVGWPGLVRLRSGLFCNSPPSRSRELPTATRGHACMGRARLGWRRLTAMPLLHCSVAHVPMPQAQPEA